MQDEPGPSPSAVLATTGSLVKAFEDRNDRGKRMAIDGTTSETIVPCRRPVPENCEDDLDSYFS